MTRIANLDTGFDEDPGKTHYMISSHYIMTLGGKEDRPVVEKNFAEMEPEEVRSQLPAGGGFMKYEIHGDTTHRTTIFALSELFEGREIITEFEVDAQTLLFRDNHHADGEWREWHMERIE